MIASMFWQNPAVVGLIVAIPGAALGYLGYRRSMKVDKVAEQAGIATTHVTSIGQVVDGLNRIITNLQDDNRVLRESVRDLNKRLNAIIKDCEELKRQVAILSSEIPH